MPRCEIGTIVIKDKHPSQIKTGTKSHAAPCNSFHGHTLKAHLPVYQFIENTCTLGAKDCAKFETGDVPSKYKVDQDVWVKIDPHTK